MFFPELTLCQGTLILRTSKRGVSGPLAESRLQIPCAVQCAQVYCAHPAGTCCCVAARAKYNDIRVPATRAVHHLPGDSGCYHPIFPLVRS